MTAAWKGREVSVEDPSETEVMLAPESADGDGGRHVLTVMAAAAGPPLGRVELRNQVTEGVMTVSWRFQPFDHDRATAALLATADWAFQRGARRLEALVEVGDTDAQRVAMAAGWVREGLRRGVPGDTGSRDLVPFARLPDDPPGAVPRLLPDLPGGVLDDGVVALRPLTVADADEAYRLRTLPEVVDTTVPPLAPSAEEVRVRCAALGAEWLAGVVAALTVRDAGTGAYLGEISLRYQSPDLGVAVLGYALRPEARGKGYATRAVRLLARWAFRHTAVQRLVAGTWDRNVASQRVLERAGFRREGVQRALLPAPDGSRRDNIEFAMVRADLSAGQDTSS